MSDKVNFFNFQKEYRNYILIFVCFQIFLSAGILYGWSSLMELLVNDDEYIELCSDPSTDPYCSERIDRFHLIFSVSQACALIATLITGIIFDMFGPRVCTIISTTGVAIGFLMLSFSDSIKIDMFFPSLILIGMSGTGIQTSAFHFSNLFPSRKHSVTSLCSGIFSLGFIIFLVAKLAHERLAISRILIFLPYSILLFIFAIISYWIYPPSTIPELPDLQLKRELYSRYGALYPNEEENESTFYYRKKPKILYSEKEVVQTSSSLWNIKNNEFFDESQSFHIHSLLPAPGVSPRITIRFPRTFIENSSSFSDHTIDYSNDHSCTLRESLLHIDSHDTVSLRQQLFSSSFMAITIYSCISIFWANLVIGTINSQIADIGGIDNGTIQSYIDLFNLILPFGFVTIPFFGYSLDKFGFSVSSLFTSLLGIIYASFFLSGDIELQIPGYIAYCLFRSCIFALLFSYVSYIFGYKFFGLLTGIIMTIAGLIGFLEYPLISLFHSEWIHINTLQLISIILMLFFVGFTFYQERKSKN